MAKPMPGELKNVDVQFVSLVDKGANRRQFKIFKSADFADDDREEDMDGSNEQEMRGFFQVLKQFFTGVKKADEEQAPKVPSFNQVIQAADAEDLIWRSFSALRGVVRGILESNVQDKTTRVGAAVEEFKTYLTGKLNQVGVAKALELYTEQPLEKAGKKISAARLKNLKDAQDLIGQIITDAEVENKTDTKEGTEVNKEELSKMVATAVTEATKPITERLEQLEKQAGEQPKTDSEAAKEQETMQGIIKEAVTKAIGPLEERLGVVEKARGISNKVPEEKEVEKSDEGSFWGGAFIGQ